VFVEELQKRGVDEIVEETRSIVGDAPVYLSFDIDSLDPAFAPGTGTPEIAGLTTPEAMALIRGFRNLSYVGADMVEVSPPFDTGGLTSMTGATVMYELLCVLAEAVSAG
jgi:guanidinopropionase